MSEGSTPPDDMRKRPANPAEHSQLQPYTADPREAIVQEHYHRLALVLLEHARTYADAIRLPRPDVTVVVMDDAERRKPIHVITSTRLEPSRVKRMLRIAYRTFCAYWPTTRRKPAEKRDP